MMSEHDRITPEPVESPSFPELEAALEHPFVSRLLELGQPRLVGIVQAGETVRPASPVRLLKTLVPASRTPLADINPPPLPQAFITLRRTAQDPMSSTGDVARIIAMDPSLTAYVLRLANSALYSLPTRVETVDRAVACIGLAEIQTMAVGAMLGKVFKDPPRPDLLVMKDFWRHAVSVGLLSSALAERLDLRGKDRFFVPGLLHDMGRLLLAIAEPELSAMALDRAIETGSSLDVAEREMLDFDHGALGGRVCKKWQLPESLGEAVACHHDPSRCPDNVMAAVVHAADFLANALGLRIRPCAGLPALDVSVLSCFGLTEEDPPQLLDALEAGLDALSATFAL